MSKLTIGILIAAMLAFGGMLFIKLSRPAEALIGIKHDQQDNKHIGRGETHDPYSTSPASSGRHYADADAPTQWGIYKEEVPDEVFLHNEEHGGVVITYNPKLLSSDQVEKLQDLFVPPKNDTKKKFEPSRFILTPRSKNTQPIELASWLWTLSLDKYDEASLTKFYTQHVNKSPEAGAKPTNPPINLTSV